MEIETLATILLLRLLRIGYILNSLNKRMIKAEKRIGIIESRIEDFPIDKVVQNEF